MNQKQLQKCHYSKIIEIKYILRLKVKDDFWNQTKNIMKNACIQLSIQPAMTVQSCLLGWVDP